MTEVTQVKKILPSIGDEIVANELGSLIKGYVTGFGKKNGERIVEYSPGERPPAGALGSKWCYFRDIASVTPAPKSAGSVISSEVLQEIRKNADYGTHPEGALTADDILGLHQKVKEGLSTTNGDAGECAVSTRQLALLLATAVNTEQHVAEPS